MLSSKMLSKRIFINKILFQPTIGVLQMSTPRIRGFRTIKKDALKISTDIC